MKIFSIKKRSGGSRTIYAPSDTEKRELREILSQISQSSLCHAHAFMANRNIVTNARLHTEKKVSVCFDLKDFFDSVTVEKVNGKISALIREKCFLLGDDGKISARQGLPTSPAIANLAGEAIDIAVVKSLKKCDITAIYTRYADDLTISSNNDSQENISKIKEIVKNTVSRCGFKLNEKKTKVQHEKGGRREICGLTVDDAVRVPRRIKRKIRAARHQYALALSNNDEKAQRKTMNSLCGLLEFSMLKEPRTKSEHEKNQAVKLQECQKIAHEYNLGAPAYVEKIMQDQKIADNMYISSDPCMIYGMSAFTTGWTSCMSITKSAHSYRKGVAFWQRLSGVSLAYIASEKNMKIAGVSRPRMSARCLLYALRDGRKAYGEIYSEHGHRLDTSHPLAKTLEAQGFVSVRDANGQLVAGNVVQPCPLPYFDNVNVETITLAQSQRKAYRVRLK